MNTGKYFRLVLSLIAVPYLSGCFTTELSAPPGKEVRILSREEPVKFSKEYKNFYLLGGLLPIWTTQPEEIIEKQNLVEVRVRTRDTVSDSVITLISCLLPIMVFPQHVIVEGNRPSDIEERCVEGVNPTECGSGKIRE
ncbi:MAG: hypothetical protein ACU837_15880 [Gammaproteobacteria bacterium]